VIRDASFLDGVYLSATVRGEDDVTIESNDPRRWRAKTS
jgi:hypothetical protein